MKLKFFSLLLIIISGVQTISSQDSNINEQAHEFNGIISLPFHIITSLIFFLKFCEVELVIVWKLVYKWEAVALVSIQL